MIVAFTYQLSKYVVFRRRALNVVGLVVDLKKSTNGNYHPILEFTTVGGREVRTRIGRGVDPLQHAKGSE